MTWNVGVGGAWKRVNNLYVGVGGAWKRAHRVWVGVGGAWKLSFSAVKLTGVSISDIEGDPTNALAGLTFGSNGALTFEGNGAPPNPSDEWFASTSSGIGSGYDVRLTVSSGDAPTSGPSTNTWHQINVDRTWHLSTNAVESLSGQWLLEIRPTGGGNTLASATFAVSAQRVI